MKQGSTDAFTLKICDLGRVAVTTFADHGLNTVTFSESEFSMNIHANRKYTCTCYRQFSFTNNTVNVNLL